MRVRSIATWCLIGLIAFTIHSNTAHAEDIGEQRAHQVGSTLIGTPAVDLDLRLMDGKSIKLSDFLGKKPIYLEFWATWCIPCREQMPHLQSVHDTYRDSVEVIAVNVGINETEESVRKFLEEKALTVPTVIDFDGSIGRAFDLTVTPQHVVIDRSGKIRYVGHLASEALDQVLATVAVEKAAPEKVLAASPKKEDTPQPKPITLLDGSRFELERESGKPTVLFFFAAWCDWYLADTRPGMSKQCIEFQEQVSALHARYGERFRWVGIAQSLWTDGEDLKSYQARLNVAYPLGVDEAGSWFAKYAVRDVPTVVILNAKGEVQSVISDSIEHLESTLGKLAQD